MELWNSVTKCNQLSGGQMAGGHVDTQSDSFSINLSQFPLPYPLLLHQKRIASNSALLKLQMVYGFKKEKNAPNIECSHVCS